MSMAESPNLWRGNDQNVLAAAAAWLHSHIPVALVTVIRTWGSSPRPPGSLLAMDRGGRMVGSVSGGCVEEDLLERYRSGELAGFPTRLDYGVRRSDAARMGLPCGGRLELLVEELHDAGDLEALLAATAEGRLLTRRVCLDSGRTTLNEGGESPSFRVSELELIKTFGPAWQMLLIGDGQLARSLAAMAMLLGYQVTICDPREEFADPFPLQGVSYTREMPDDAVRARADHPRSAIVTLAHDPRQDDLALLAALESRAFYVGALGSTRTAAGRRKRLGEMGVTLEQLRRLHGPAGLPIGSKRPEEIAVSILAQITAVRNTAPAAALPVPLEQA
jgi:xanthine dehydrogenase accessory factor